VSNSTTWTNEYSNPVNASQKLLFVKTESVWRKSSDMWYIYMLLLD